MPSTSFTQLAVWKKARLLTVSVTALTEQYPHHQRFGLTAQMQRAAVSIGANISEGYGRGSPKDRARYYRVSQGSAEELQHCLLISRDLGYLSGTEEVWQMLDDIGAMLRRLIQDTLRDSTGVSEDPWCGSSERTPG